MPDVLGDAYLKPASFIKHTKHKGFIAVHVLIDVSMSKFVEHFALLFDVL